MKLFAVFALISSLHGQIISKTVEPHFASIKVSKANLRVGPSKDYKILCKYTKKNLPVLITAQYDNWRKIKDWEGEEGWIHKSQLSTTRYVITKDNCTLYKTKDPKSSIQAKLKKNVLLKLKNIDKEYCYLEKDKIKGFVLKQYLYGV